MFEDCAFVLHNLALEYEYNFCYGLDYDSENRKGYWSQWYYERWLEGWTRLPSNKPHDVVFIDYIGMARSAPPPNQWTLDRVRRFTDQSRFKKSPPDGEAGRLIPPV